MFSRRVPIRRPVADVVEPAGGSYELPPAPGVPLSVLVAETGSMRSRACLAYKGGDLTELPFGMDCFVVEHPEGILVCEGGFGRNLREHLKSVDRLMRALATVDPDLPLADQLRIADIDPSQLRGILLTHAHWDHVGAVEDLPGTPVLVNDMERQFIETGGHHTALLRSFPDVAYELYEFDGGPYAGFERSHDVWGDGSVVAVPVGAHTPGSVLIFLRATDRDYVLIGDQAWQHEAVEVEAGRPWLTSRMVDWDRGGVETNLARLHRLAAANPGLVLVPSHDRRVTSTLPRLLGVRNG